MNHPGAAPRIVLDHDSGIVVLASLSGHDARVRPTEPEKARPSHGDGKPVDTHGIVHLDLHESVSPWWRRHIPERSRVDRLPAALHPNVDMRGVEVARSGSIMSGARKYPCTGGFREGPAGCAPPHARRRRKRLVR